MEKLEISEIVEDVLLRFLADLLRGGGFGRDDSNGYSKGSLAVSSTIFSAANSASLLLLAFLFQFFEG